MIGGLRPESGPAWDEEFKEYLKHHWREVNKRSGQPFAFDLFERALSTIILNLHVKAWLLHVT